MLKKMELPLMEFDEDRSPLIDPQKNHPKLNIPEHCVIAFFSEVIESKRAAGLLKQVAVINSATVNLPVYELEYKQRKVCLVLGFLGSPSSAAQLEELIAFGCSKFIVCGGAGVLQKDIAVGHLIVPYAAVRDEGTSYHYVPASREIECDQEACAVIEQRLTISNIPYIRAKTWTTDGFYRETRDKVNLRVSEGCVTVEMEAAAFFAVSKFRGVKLGQILYGGDDLSGIEWDNRNWVNRGDIRSNLVDLSLDICLDL